MAKVNNKGRTKHVQFIRLHRGVTQSEAWQHLSCEATRLLLLIWERHNGFNNGRIPYGYEEARKGLHVGSRKVAKAFRELEEKGFIVARRKGHFDWKTGAGQRLATEWELTMEACDGRLPRLSYHDWKPDTGNRNDR